MSQRAALSEETQAALMGCDNEFLDSDLLQSDIDDIMSFHEARPITLPQRTQADIFSVEADVEERLQLAKSFFQRARSEASDVEDAGHPLQYSDWFKDFKPSALHLAFVMYSDMELLRQFSDEVAISIVEVANYLANSECLLARCKEPLSYTITLAIAQLALNEISLIRRFTVLQRGGIQSLTPSRASSQGSLKRLAEEGGQQSGNKKDQDKAQQPDFRKTSVGRSRLEALEVS